ncbi:cupin domain-containing protein [Halorubellus litoreus]|uniref:Cupin domain-containing protein n=1 Tax=Halorubellus litoreus TaxID=755308 RepID=A0ABD5VEW7_9EURY
MKRATVDSSRGRDAVGEALDANALAAVRYRLAPGEGFPSGLHAHHDQEEVFVVLEGEATFEVLPPAESWDDGRPTGREVTVAASEAVRFAPGEFQTGRNPATADEAVVALALGAPKGTSDVRVPAACPRAECDALALRLGTGGATFTFDCPACGDSFAPAPCPACESGDLAMHLDADGHPVARCADCECEFERPPFEK